MQSTADAPLTRRWVKLPRIRPVHKRYFYSPARRIVVPAGRRSYKTEIAKRKLVRRALATRRQGARFVAASTTHQHAKDIFWRDLNDMIPPEWVTASNRTDLTIELLWGQSIRVMGMDAPARIEGSMLDGIVLDEFGDMKPEVWGEHVSPALADSGGWSIILGVPSGRNHYYDLYQHARADDTGTWQTYTWPSSWVLSPEYLEAERATLDERTYRQEYEAEFVDFAGRAYYKFDAELHAAGFQEYDPHQPELCFLFDFNVSPGVALVVQEARTYNYTRVIGEVFIPRDSNTEQVCRALIHGMDRRGVHCPGWGHHEGPVYYYGDPSGGARRTSARGETDWSIVRKVLRAHYGDRVYGRVPRAPPPVRARVNAVNSRLMSHDRQVRCVIDRRCKYLVRDLEGVQTHPDGSGELDKKKNPLLTHSSDALGYYLAERFPVEGRLVVVDTF